MATHTFSCFDGHTCGNPVRLVAGGGPRLDGATMLERRAHFLRDYDWIRTGLMFEPRGHDMMSGSILYPPADRNQHPVHRRPRPLRPRLRGDVRAMIRAVVARKPRLPSGSSSI